MRISDWSSDVCSSDLVEDEQHAVLVADPADALEVVGHRRHRTGGRADHGLGQKGDDLVLPQLEDLGLELIGEALGVGLVTLRSEEHKSEIQSLMRISYAVFCLKKKNNTYKTFNRRYTEH